MTHTDVLIIGGGWAGLWSARALAGTGLSVRLIERREVLGGRAITDGPPGYHLNLGAHALYRRGAARAALAEVGIVPKGGVPVQSGALALIGDEAHPMPTGWISFLTTSLLDGGARWAVAGALARAMRVDTATLAGRSIGAWLDETVPHPKARAVFSMLLRVTTYARDEHRLDAAFALEQLRSGLRGNVLYVDGGWGTVVSALRDAAVGVGADLRVGVTAQALRSDGGEIEVETSAGPVRARAVIVATPPDTAGKLLPTLDVSALRPMRAAILDVALRRLPVADRTFALAVDRPLYLSVHSAVAALAPPGGAVIHTIRYGGAEGDSEAELEGLLDRVQPGWRDEVVERRYLPRITVAHALPGPDRPRPEASGVDGVFLAGDWVGPTGMLADAALASARVAVRAVEARLGVAPVARRA